MKRLKQFAQSLVKSHTKLLLWLIMAPVTAAAVAIQHLDPATNALHTPRSVILNEYIPGMLWIAALLYSIDPVVLRSKRYLLAIGASYMAPIAFAVAVFQFLPIVGHRFIPVPAPLVWLNVFGLLNVVVCRNFLRRRILAVAPVTVIVSEPLRQTAVTDDSGIATLTDNPAYPAATASVTVECNPEPDLLVRLNSRK